MKIRRSSFHMQPRNTFTCEMGYAVPIACIETYPGDSWSFNINDAVRMIPMLAPQYTDISVSVMAFKVALRTIWDEWEQFRTGGADNQDTTVAPYILFSHANSNVGFSTLSDYLGIPPLTFYTKDSDGVYQPNTQVVKASALPFRAYNKIWNEWLRVEHIQNEVTISKASGYDTTTSTALLRRRWNRDIFTNCLPNMQLGPQAYLPIALSAPVKGNGKNLGITDGTGEYGVGAGVSSTAYTLISTTASGVTNGQSVTAKAFNGNIALGLSTDGTKSGVVADLSSAAAVPWSMVRLTGAMQRMGEKLMLGGARLPEFYMSFFGVKSSDARLDRSEYLGGFTSDVHISPIMQTSSTDATSPQGNQAAVAYHVAGTRRFHTFCEEEGFIIVLMSIRPRTTYCQGLHKKFQRWTRYDYMNPMFAHLSLQPLKQSQLYLTGVTNGDNTTNWDDSSLPDNGTFGFTPNYQELRSLPNEMHGDMLNTRQYWNMARIFDTAPQLNSTFIECHPTKRPFAVTTENGSPDDVCLCETMLDIYVKRVLPKVGTPKF